MGLRRWETYVALIAVILATLAPIAQSPRTTLAMALGAAGLIIVVAVAIMRRARIKRKPEGFDAYARAEQIREARENRRAR